MSSMMASSKPPISSIICTHIFINQMYSIHDTRFFYKKKVNIFRKSLENHEAPFPKLIVFIGHISIFRHYCIQDVKKGIQIQIYNITNECLAHFSQFISEKVKKNLRKSQAQFRQKLGKLRLRQNYGFLIKKRVLIR